MWDVIIVGAGPGGSVTAKACAHRGLKTLILEKKRLPRDKVCSGLVAGPMARDVIRQEFGIIPQAVLCPPYELSGQIFHVPGAEPGNLEWKTLLAWRKDLDYWFTQKAQEEGAEVWDRTRVIKIEENEGRFNVHFKTGNSSGELKTDFLIGADGAGSIVRKFLFPDLKVRYSTPIRECYEGALDLDKSYLHWFFPRSRPRPRFCVNHKGDYFLVEGSGLKGLRSEVIDTLGPYGFRPDSRPIWRDACLIPLLHEGLISDSFSPARGRALLIGDAAGLLFPISFEGIGVALKSGMLAADSIFESASSQKDPTTIYLEALSPIINQLKRLYLIGQKLEKESGKVGEALLNALKDGYEAALYIV
jgi:flavin-dependent dehydrogenase